MAQNDSINQVKYWKLRNRFVEKFVKIGPEAGESLPAGARVPKHCIDNVANDGTDPAKWERSDYGEMHWGDGMIRHGHYLALLATEYALKKKYNQNLKGIRSELYYALYAINRLDLKAERDLALEYGTAFQGTMNGFYLREDVPEDFCLNWKNDPMRFRCTNSAYYENNNVAKLNDKEQGFYVKPKSSYQNGPSMDQMSSLLVGLSMVHKLVDDTFVKPKDSDLGFLLVTETANIVQRIVTYASDQNWELIDVNGWPVANGGGDLAFAAFPYVLAANRITGNPIDSYTDHFYRRRLKYHPKYFELQHCITGFGTSGSLNEQQAQCEGLKLNIFHPGLKRMYKRLLPGATVGPLNNQNNSVYLDWNKSGYYHRIKLTHKLWDNHLANGVTKWRQKAKDGPQVAGLRSMESISSFNQAIVFNIGVTGGNWNSSMAHFFGNKTENRHLELANAVLYDQTPAGSKEFYQSYLNSMPMVGPYNMVGKNWTPNPDGPWYAEYHCAPNGWGADYRWTEPDESYGAIGKEGVFSGLDYMLLHNLYYLLFDGDLPEFKQRFDCHCMDKLKAIIPADVKDEEHIEAYRELNSKLRYVPTCDQNVFDPVRNIVSKRFEVRPYFEDYPELGIETAKYQKEDVYVENFGSLIVRTNLIIYKDRFLMVEHGGRVAIEAGSILPQSGVIIDVHGDLIVSSGAKLKLNAGTKLILRSGSRLIIEDRGSFKLEKDAVLEMYKDATISASGESVNLSINGAVRMMDGGVFNVTKQIGYLR
ncbi:hypothetical protein OAU25_01985 [Crocinitomicaceae bacterium]|nr:hypothetical protein [Crocinitomicaceae bacterium]